MSKLIKMGWLALIGLANAYASAVDKSLSSSSSKDTGIVELPLEQQATLIMACGQNASGSVIHLHKDSFTRFDGPLFVNNGKIIIDEGAKVVGLEKHVVNARCDTMKY
ncbi:MAG: hypothetical protein LBF56_03440 [Holosporales bacterium]|nr:hypothetical protein [Holosporales bacterium]